VRRTFDVSEEYCLKTKATSIRYAMILAAAVSGAGAVAAVAHADEQDEGVLIWERGKDGGDPFAAIRQMANLPEGEDGQTAESLKAEIIESGGRIVSETDHQIVARGRMDDGVEVNVNISYQIADGVVRVGGEGKARGSRID
jgi:hypothetical protein